MTSAYLWKIDCIFVNIDRFSSKFWYVLAETIFYKCSFNYSSFWQRHHGVFFAIKGGMSIFYILRVFSMGHDFFSKLDSTFPFFASNIYVVLASFTLNFEYVVAETKSYLKCTLHFVSIFCWISPPILVPNKYYKSNFYLLFPLFCSQDNSRLNESIFFFFIFFPPQGFYWFSFETHTKIYIQGNLHNNINKIKLAFQDTSIDELLS